ncbi:MAG: nucleotide sugar dehydrogenase [Nitrososphaerales archaeon]
MKTKLKTKGASEGIFHLTASEALRRFKSGKASITVVGLGRIGLPTAAMFANAGLKVLGADINPAVVVSVNEGRCRFVDEPGLEKIVKRAAKKGNLRATTDVAKAVSETDLVVICVPTPVDHTKTPDYAAVIRASRTIGKALRSGQVVIMESTVGPGTVEEVIRPVLEEESRLRAGVDFGLASCPERSDPGNIIENMKTVPRVIGAVNEHTEQIVASLYENALGVKVFRASNPKTANAIKLTENLFRDVNIALANEFALLFEKLGIDTIEVINGCATKYNFMPHYPGAGVGGPCLPSNSYYLIVEGIKSGNIPYIIRMAREINDRMPDHVIELVSEALNEVRKTVRGSKVAVLGVAYKPDIKDAQLSPLERVCNSLKELGANVEIYDPMFAGERVFGFPVKRSLAQAVKGADCIVIGTAHKEFQNLDLKALAGLVSSPAAFVDARNIASPKALMSAGFAYRGVGRKFGTPSQEVA